jgi:hypothetical protein
MGLATKGNQTFFRFMVVWLFGAPSRKVRQTLHGRAFARTRFPATLSGRPAPAAGRQLACPPRPGESRCQMDCVENEESAPAGAAPIGIDPGERTFHAHFAPVRRWCGYSAEY